MTFTRRELFGLAGATASLLVLAACGKSKPATVTSTLVESSGSTPAAGKTPVVPGGPQTASAAPMDATTANRQAAAGNGHWLGAWHDDSGRSGTSDVVVNINAAQQSAQATVSFTGPITGADVPDTIYEIYGLLSFVLGGTDYDIQSPQFGRVHINGAGEHSATATATNIPGRPDISGVDISLSTRGHRSDLTYTINSTTGKTVKGTMAWSADGSRATPAALGTDANPTPADIQTGTYAAGLLSATQLSSATGIPFEPPKPNGGRLNYTTTINVSNGTADSTSGRYSLSYSVYLGTADAVSAFWKNELLGLPLIPGPWLGAFFYPTIPTFYGYVATRAFTIKIVDKQATTAPDAATLANVTAQLTELAKALAAALAS